MLKTPEEYAQQLAKVEPGSHQRFTKMWAICIEQQVEMIRAIAKIFRHSESPEEAAQTLEEYAQRVEGSAPLAKEAQRKELENLCPCFCHKTGFTECQDCRDKH